MKAPNISSLLDQWSSSGEVENGPVAPGLMVTILEEEDPVLQLLPDLSPGSAVFMSDRETRANLYSRDQVSVSRNSGSESWKTPQSVASDISGSPLKMQEIAELNLNNSSEDVFVRERSYFEERGLKVEIGRNIASQLSHSNFEYPIHVLCNGKNLDGLVCIGYKPMREDNLFTYSSMTVYDRSEKPVSISTLRAMHASNTGCPKGVLTCTTTYSIRTIPQPDGPSAFLRLETSSSAACRLLDEPNSDSRVSVSVRAVAGCKESRISSIYRELLALKGFVQALENQQISWLIEHREEPVIVSAQNLFKKMTSLKSSVPSPLDVTTNEGTVLGDNTVLPEMEGVTTGAERSLQDFTEQLWSILIDCSSYKELCEVLSWLFQTLRTSRIVPVVEPNNPSELARLIRSADENNNFNTPNLVGLAPLNLLIEIGIFKLRRDYLQYFKSHGMLDSGLLIYYSDLSLTVNEQVARLEKLHVSMEAVSMATQYLNDLDRSAVSALSRHCLQHYQNHEPNPEHVFTVPVHYKNLHNITASLSPSSWSAVIESSVDDVIMKTRCLLTDAAPSGSGVVLLDAEDSVDGDLAKRRFCLTKTCDVLQERIWQK